jgi:hypothetical protein
MQVHPSEISPAEAFDVFYFLRNHTDGATYYVRGVVYDVRTGEILATTNLDQSATNARLFIKTLQAPPDPVGIGRNIVAIATVYTDSGYSAKSPDYEEQEQYFLIKASLPFYGGGGVDMRAMRELVQEEIAAAVSKLPKPQSLPDMPFEAVFGAIGALQREINRIPKETADDAPVLAAIADLKTAIDALPPPETTDLAPVQDDLSTILSAVTALKGDIEGSTSNVLKGSQGQYADMSKRILTDLEKSIKDFIGRQELTIPLSKLMQDKPAPTPQPTQDLAHIM